MADEQVEAPGITADSPEWEKAEPLYKQAYPDLDTGFMKQHYNSARSQKIIEENEGNRLKGVGGDYTPMRPWDEMKEHYQNVYPDLDPDQMGQQYGVAKKLHETRRQMYMANPDSLGETVARNLSSLGSKMAGRSATDPSWNRIKAGEGTDQDYRNVAAYETMGVNQQAQGQTLGGAVTQGVVAAPEQVSQFMLGRGMLPEASGVAANAGLGALSTFANPVQVLPGAAERAERQGGELYSPQNLLPAAAQTALSNAVMGSVSHWASGVKNPVARFAATVAGGTAEMQIPKEILARLDERLPEAYQTQTKYGIVGSLLNGKDTDEALREATKDAIVMGFLHGGTEALGKLGGKAEAPKLIEKAQEAAVKATERGATVQEAVAEARGAMNAHVDEFKTREQLPKDATGKPEGWDENVKQMVAEGMPYEEAVKSADQAHGLETQATLPQGGENAAAGSSVPAGEAGANTPGGLAGAGADVPAPDAGVRGGEPAGEAAAEAKGEVNEGRTGPVPGGAAPGAGDTGGAAGPGGEGAPVGRGEAPAVHPEVQRIIDRSEGQLSPEEALSVYNADARGRGVNTLESPRLVREHGASGLAGPQRGLGRIIDTTAEPTVPKLGLRKPRPYDKEIREGRATFEENRARFEDLTRRLGDATSPEQRSAISKEMDEILDASGISGRHLDILNREAAGQTHAEIADETGIPRSTVGDLSRRWREILGAKEGDLDFARKFALKEGLEKYGDVEGRLGEGERAEEGKLGLKKKRSPEERAEDDFNAITDEWLKERQKDRPDAAKLNALEDQANAHWKNAAKDYDDAIHDDHTRATGKRGAEQQASIRRDIAGDVQKSDTLQQALASLQGGGGEPAAPHAEAAAADALREAAGDRVKEPASYKLGKDGSLADVGEGHKEFANVYHSVLGRMNKKLAGLVGKMVKGIQVHESLDSLMHEFLGGNPNLDRETREALANGARPAAFATENPDGTTTLHFFKGNDQWTIAHELGHAIAHASGMYEHPEYIKHYNNEIAAGQLGAYASSNRYEGAADFLASLHGGGYTSDIEDRFPGTSEHVKGRGFWPEGDDRDPGSVDDTVKRINEMRGMAQDEEQQVRQQRSLWEKAKDYWSNLVGSGSARQKADLGLPSQAPPETAALVRAQQRAFDAGEPSPEAQRTIGDAVRQHLADLYGSDAASLNTDRMRELARGVKEDMLKAYHGLADVAKNIASIAVPGLSRASPDTANAGVKLVKTGEYVQRKGYELVRSLLPKGTEGTERDREFGDTFKEERFRKARQNYLDAAKRASNDAAAARAAGDKDAAKEFANKATEYIISARKTPTTVPGTKTPGGDPALLQTNAVLRDEQHFQKILQDPEYQKARQGWREKITPIANEHFRNAQGLEEDDPINSISQIPDSVMHLKRVTEGPEPEEKGKLGLKGTSKTVGAAQKLYKYKYASPATFEGEAYENRFSEMIKDALSGAHQANKAKFYRTLVDQGVGEWGPKGESRKGYTRFDGVNPPPGTQEAKGRFDPETGERQKPDTELFVKDEHANDVKKILGAKEGWKLPGPLGKILDMWTKSSVMSTIEPAYHSVNQVGKLIAQGNGLTNMARLAKNLYGNYKDSPEFLAHVADLAEAGLTKPQHELPQRMKYSPLKLADLSTKWLRALDIASRVALDQAYQDAAKGEGWTKGWFGKLEFSEENRRNYINSGAGLYDKNLQNGAIRLLTDTGIGPFAVTSANAPIQGARTLLGSYGGKAASTADAIKLRAFQLAKIAALVGSTRALNYMVWGNPNGDDNTPFGAFKLGDDGKGHTSYFDPAHFFGGLRRGYNAVGGAAMEDYMRRDKAPSGAVDVAKERLLDAMVHPMMGPAVSFGKEAWTGKDTFGKDIAEPSDAGRGMLGSFFHETSLGSAIRRANPTVGTVTGNEWTTGPELASKLTGLIGSSHRSPPEVSNFYDTLRSTEKEFQANSKKATDQGLRIKEPRELSGLQQASKQLHDLQLRMNNPETSASDFKELRARQVEIARHALDAYKEIKSNR